MGRASGVLVCLAALLILLPTTLPRANAQSPQGTVYVVTHLDIMPNFAAQANELLRGFATATREDADLMRYDLLLQDARTNHFAVIEVWRSREAFEAHAGHPHSVEFRQKLGPMLGSPFDVRLHSALP